MDARFRYLIGVFMKAIKGLIITLIVIVALAGVTIIGGYIFVRSTDGNGLFRTAGGETNI